MILEFSRRAQRDLDEIFQYSLTNWGAARALGYLADLTESAEALARGDISGIDAAHVRQGLRSLPVGSHMLWFRVGRGKVVIVRVLHQSRDAGMWVG